MSEEGKLKVAFERGATMAREAADALSAPIEEWKARIAPAINAAVDITNPILTDVAIRLKAHPFVSQILITPTGTLEFPGMAIATDTGTKRDNIFSQPAPRDPAFEQLSLSQPYLDVRLDANSRILVVGHGCNIARAGNFLLEQFDETQIRETILEFTKAIIRSLSTS